MFTYNTRVRYSEVASDGFMSVEGIMDLMQSCSSFESEDSGVSFDRLMELGQVWVLNSWQIVFKRRPLLYENIRVSTWAYDNQEIFGYRNYHIEDESGDTCVYANTVWVMTDPKTGRPKKAIPEAYAGYQEEKPFSMNYEDRKIKIPNERIKKDSFFIKKRHIDTLLHVNNVRYIEMGMEYIPEDFQWNQLRVQYIKSARLGDEITVSVVMTEQEFYISLEDENRKPYAVLEVKDICIQGEKND